MDDPQFKVRCDQLTAFLRDTKAAAGAKPSPGAKTSATPKPSASPAASPGGKNGGPGGGGLQRAIAEGHVIIIQDRPAADGQEPQHNVGKSQRADYNADTGDIVLTGWPQVQQGMNTQVATEESTVMTMNKDGHTMNTKGASKTVIQEQSASSPAAKPQ